MSSAPPTLLEMPWRKRVRAAVIAEYVRRAGYRGVVCFSCGNAARALQETGLFTVAVAPGAALQTDAWWDQDQIHKTWPDLLDATSGHLPVPLMYDIGAELTLELRRRRTIIEAGAHYTVLSGSGETLVCLAMANNPLARFRAKYDMRDAATTYDARAPLNGLVVALSGGPALVAA